MSEYRGRDYPVYHFDLYRIDDPTELHQIGYIEYVYGGGITIIEWAQKVIEDLPADRIEIELIRTGATQREIRFTSYPSSFPAHEIVGSFRNGG
jgi:tRNA threonylcarbamoyladenosine biosynthesis protein TsaB